ncbi:MAG: polyprenyl synthetase family protein [Candidatus Omnitrophica bacterium]|nr:polyprenyl synthetase family protein [Candidatus Omnitrophota bacterium]
MTVLRASLDEIYVPIENELKDFHALLKKELASDDLLIDEINRHLLKMTGKFLRPALALLAAKSGDATRREAVDLAVAIELIHTATLVHDDIIDGSELRRNQPSLHSKWGREISIVAGDYLYAKAFLLLAGLKDARVSEAFARCAHVMCEGELKQIEKRNHFVMDEAEYLRIIHQKTAALFQAACMGGGYFSEASFGTIEGLGDYGFQLGMAFQIVDDCLDLTGETRSLGKAVGVDIHKNDVTLPLLYLFGDLGESEKRPIVEAIAGGDTAVFHRIQKLALENRSVEKAMERARAYADKAVGALDVLKPSACKDSLAQLAYYCLERKR